MEPRARRRWKARAVVYGGGLLLLLGGGWFMTSCPNGPVPFSSAAMGLDAAGLADLEARLRRHVEVLAGEIGERNVFRPEALAAAASYIETAFLELGMEPVGHDYSVESVTCRNIECDLTGGGAWASTSSARTEESSARVEAGVEGLVLVGAHYDSVLGSPGADDNATGVAAMLEIARMFQARPPRRRVRFVAFVNEEPPFFTTDTMGSRVYAAMARRRGDSIHAMVSLESIGYYSDEPGSQQYPPGIGLFYPDAGNFVAVVGSLWQRPAVHRFDRYLREACDVPVECIATFESVPGVSWSDHASFWEQGYAALMVTDTAPYRNPYYHHGSDRPATVDYPRLARVTAALASALGRLAGE